VAKNYKPKKTGGVPKPTSGTSGQTAYKPIKSSEQGFGIRTGDTFTRAADWKRINVGGKSSTRKSAKKRY
jgi:hypothetical protein